ncbi:MAG: N-6 DNA methylase [Desulfuromonadales bacterium]
MNMILHDMAGNMENGDTMRNPKFLDGSSLKHFDVVVANPMWNQKEWDETFYDADPQMKVVGRDNRWRPHSIQSP